MIFFPKFGLKGVGQRYLNFSVRKKIFLMGDLEGVYACEIAAKRYLFMDFFFVVF